MEVNLAIGGPGGAFENGATSHGASGGGGFGLNAIYFLYEGPCNQTTFTWAIG